MAEAFGADLAAGLVAKLVSLAAKQVIQAWNLDKDLDTLRERFETIGLLLHDAHIKKITMPALQKLFNQLQDVANDTQSLLDELAYEATRKNVKNHGKAWDSFIPSKNPLYCHKVAAIHDSFDEIFKWAKELGLDAVAPLNINVQPKEICCEPPHEDKTLIVGRDKDISNLVQIVCKNNDQDLHVVAIVGMGGQGKTTLARRVLDNDDVIKMFAKRMWLTVSDDFNFINILNEMLKSLTLTTLQLKNSLKLVNELQKRLKGEKFLLVLDDVWNEESKKWEDLKNSLLEVGGAKGSSVVVTTRNQGVISAMQNCVPYSLETLKESDSYELFKKIAFQDGAVLEMEPFSDMGKSMVKRCGGLPLAIKALGGMLRSMKSEEDWQKIQNSETWTSQDVMPSLRLSYDNLPYSSLKRCFVHCSIIPKNSLIYKDELIQIWMALGFLLPPLGSDALMEDIGRKYFNILLQHSLLQDIDTDIFGNIQSCKMHDLVHDLALDLSKKYSVTVKTGLELNHVSNATYVRLDNRVSVLNPTILRRNFEKVQLLYARDFVFRDVLDYVKHLTVLVLNTGFSDEKAMELPKSLENMKYIKHLDISCLGSKLPSYITELYNLQTLRVQDLEEFPKKFCNLINLRHLYIEKCREKRCLLYGIERLTCLQTLPYFVVSKDQSCLIGQLEGLQHLRGTVKLYGLEDVPNRQEASKAKLCSKFNIQSLFLSWKTGRSERANNSEYEREMEYKNECVMEGLEPHTNLKELNIASFMGKRFALWIRKMTDLVKIQLWGCHRCEEFPSLGHLPKLREIIFRLMSDLRIIGSYDASESGNCGAAAKDTYPSLTELRLHYLSKLEKWLEQDTSGVSGDQVQVFPKLELLQIISCPNLKIMPDSCFPSLKKLTIKNSDMILEAMMSRKVSSLTYLYISIGYSIGGRSSSFMDTVAPLIEELLKNNSQSLKYLILENCRGLRGLPVGVALEELSVYDCPDLTSIKAVEETCSLKYLDIQIGQSVSSTIKELQIVEITGAFPALTRLTIGGFKGLKALPDTIAKLPSLDKLIISRCEDLESLPTFHQSHTIRHLYIRGCNILEERCKQNGPEWYKIQHIPDVSYARW